MAEVEKDSRERERKLVRQKTWKKIDVAIDSLAVEQMKKGGITF